MALVIEQPGHLGVSVGIEELIAAGDGQAPAPAGVQTYQIVTVTSGDADTIGTGFVLSFKIDKTWLSQNQITTVILYRLENEAWHAYTPTQTGADANYSYYAASLPGLSVFLIGGKAVTPGPVLTNTTVQNVTVIPSATTPAMTNQNKTSQGTPTRSQPSLFIWLLLGGLIVLLAGGLTFFAQRQKAKPEDDLGHHLALLRQFIEKQMDAGHTGYDVEQAVLKAGWPGHFVEQAFHDLNIPWRNPNEESTAKKKMDHPHDPLRDYIDTCRDKGIPLERIREVLLRAGWKGETIEPVLQEYTHS